VNLDEARRLSTVISVAQAGKLLGIQRSCAYELVQDGTIPVIRYGRALRVPTARVLAMLGIDREGGDGASSSTP
jgi:excisionase family DNA binding protein